MELFPKICFRYWLKYFKHNPPSGERWSRFEKVHKRDAARHSRWSPTTQPHSDIINLIFAGQQRCDHIQKMSLQSYFSGKISHDLLGSVEIPLKNIPASGVCTFCKINVFFWRKTIIFLSIRLPLSQGEWLVEPGEAWDEEAEGARRNPSHHDPQVLRSLNRIWTEYQI